MLTGNDTKQNSSNGMSTTLADVCTGSGEFWPTDMWVHQSPFDEGQLQSESRSKFTSKLFSFPSLGSFSIPYPFPFSLSPPPTGPG